VLPPMTRNTRGNKLTNTKIYGNLVNNWVTIISFNNALSCKFMTVVSVTLTLRHSRRLRVASGATVPDPALEGAPRFRPKVVLMSLSSYILQ
jgi:hypothetical protein